MREVNNIGQIYLFYLCYWLLSFENFLETNIEIASFSYSRLSLKLTGTREQTILVLFQNVKILQIYGKAVCLN